MSIFILLPITVPVVLCPNYILSLAESTVNRNAKKCWHISLGYAPASHFGLPFSLCNSPSLCSIVPITVFNFCYLLKHFCPIQFNHLNQKINASVKISAPFFFILHLPHPLSQFLNGILGHPLGSTFLQKWTALCREQACSDGLFGSLVTGKDQEEKGKKEKKKEKFSYRQRKICLKLKNLPFFRKQKISGRQETLYEYQ